MVTWAIKIIWRAAKFAINLIERIYVIVTKKDVLLLADVFEEFIDTCLKFYKLDPCHYFNYSGLSWDTMLKMTGVKFEKNWDIDMYLFIEKGLRGGFLTLLKDTVKQITNTWKIMILKFCQYIYRTLIWIIRIVVGWVIIVLMVDLSG